MNTEKSRVVAIPIPTWKSLKRASAELEKPMSVLITDAWKKWSEQDTGGMVLAK